MSQEPKAGMEVSSDDKLWAALAYVFSPLVPIIILLMEDKKSRPYIKALNIQALVWGLLVWVVFGSSIAVVIGFCLFPLGLLVELYWAYKAYQGEMVKIPVITDFVKNQGWA